MLMFIITYAVYVTIISIIMCKLFSPKLIIVSHESNDVMSDEKLLLQDLISRDNAIKVLLH